MSLFFPYQKRNEKIEWVRETKKIIITNNFAFIMILACSIDRISWWIMNERGEERQKKAFGVDQTVEWCFLAASASRNLEHRPKLLDAPPLFIEFKYKSLCFHFDKRRHVLHVDMLSPQRRINDRVDIFFETWKGFLVVCRPCPLPPGPGPRGIFSDNEPGEVLRYANVWIKARAMFINKHDSISPFLRAFELIASRELFIDSLPPPRWAAKRTLPESYEY